MDLIALLHWEEPHPTMPKQRISSHFQIIYSVSMTAKYFSFNIPYTEVPNSLFFVVRMKPEDTRDNGAERAYKIEETRGATAELEANGMSTAQNTLFESYLI